MAVIGRMEATSCLSWGADLLIFTVVNGFCVNCFSPHARLSMETLMFYCHRWEISQIPFSLFSNYTIRIRKGFCISLKQRQLLQTPPTLHKYKLINLSHFRFFTSTQPVIRLFTKCCKLQLLSPPPSGSWVATQKWQSSKSSLVISTLLSFLHLRTHSCSPATEASLPSNADYRLAMAAPPFSTVAAVERVSELKGQTLPPRCAKGGKVPSKHLRPTVFVEFRNSAPELQLRLDYRAPIISLMKVHRCKPVSAVCPGTRETC